MLRLVNRYCSNCLRTQRFVDLGAHLVCVSCTKQLQRTRPVPVKVENPIVTWTERADLRTPQIRRDAG